MVCLISIKKLGRPTAIMKALLPLLLVSTTVHAGPMEWLKGCLILGGAGVGGTVMAASSSNVSFKDSQPLVVAGITSCIIGGIISEDVSKRAEMKASAELLDQNARLKHHVYNVMHDLCVIKGTCGPDGIERVTREGQEDGTLNDYKSLKSGN